MSAEKVEALARKIAHAALYADKRDFRTLAALLVRAQEVLMEIDAMGTPQHQSYTSKPDHSAIRAIVRPLLSDLDSALKGG